MPAPNITQASVKSAIAAASAVGLTPIAMVVRPDGSLRLEFLSDQLNNAANSVPMAASWKAPKK
ncbi:hypothetical protein [Heliomarina baculiformis]|uniref:hypothetical protein n=1 Tax=Heliomarina baculiformis TaxID=2872036 RepID=UPI001EE295FC|nr:hypothetical protein [Heliomarina baculiformis]